MATPDPFAGVPDENPGVSGAQSAAPPLKKNPDSFASVPNESTTDLGPMGTNPAGNTAISGVRGDLSDMFASVPQEIGATFKTQPGASTNIAANVAESIAEPFTMAANTLAFLGGKAAWLNAEWLKLAGLNVDPNEVEARAERALAYTPKTIAGQKEAAAMALPLTVTGAYGHAIGEKILETDPNHPALAAAASVLPDAVLLLGGGRGGTKVAEPDFASWWRNPAKTAPVDRAGVAVTHEQLAAGHEEYAQGLDIGKKLVTDQSKPCEYL